MFGLVPGSGKPENPISLSVAKRRPPKTTKSFWITAVMWGKYKPKTKKVFFPSLKQEFELAIPPDLPKGYKMETHDTWYSTNQALLEAAKVTKDFELLEALMEDCKLLERETGMIPAHPYDLADFHPPEGFNQWSILREHNKNLAEMKLSCVIDSLPDCFHFEEAIVFHLKDGRVLTVPRPRNTPIPEDLANIPLADIASVQLSIRSELKEWKEEYSY